MRRTVVGGGYLRFGDSSTQAPGLSINTEGEGDDDGAKGDREIGGMKVRVKVLVRWE